MASLDAWLRYYNEEAARKEGRSGWMSPDRSTGGRWGWRPKDGGPGLQDFCRTPNS